MEGTEALQLFRITLVGTRIGNAEPKVMRREILTRLEEKGMGLASATFEIKGPVLTGEQKARA